MAVTGPRLHRPFVGETLRRPGAPGVPTATYPACQGGAVTSLFLFRVRPLRKSCDRYGVESAAEQLGMGNMWPAAVKRATLAKVRALPTYDPATDTVVVCRYV